MSSDIHERLSMVNDRIEAACASVGRSPDEVEIIAVTKTHPIEVLEGAVAAGLTDLGESRVQEGLPKVEAMGDRARIHLIGRLQTNKVNKAVGEFSSIATVDRDELLNRVDRRAGELEIVQDIWIQVNVTGEGQKGGCTPEEACGLWERVAAASSVAAHGLMTLARVEDDEAGCRRSFERLRELAESLPGVGDSRPRLSMGMSRDFEWALLEGSDQLRLGSVLFGPRGPR